MAVFQEYSEKGTLSLKKVKVAQSCPTLCDPIDYTVRGVLQARILEWVAFPFSRGSSQPRMEPRSPALQEDSLPAEPQGGPLSLRSFIKSREAPSIRNRRDKDLERMSSKILIFKSYFSLSYLLWLFILTRFTG